MFELIAITINLVTQIVRRL